MKKLILLGLALAAFSAALAMPTVLGVSGGFFVPNADIQKGITVTASSDDDWDYNIPLVQLLVGVTPNLELGAGGFKWTSSDMQWYVAGKYLLPWTIAKGKLTVSGLYDTGDSDAEWVGTISGTWPVFASSEFTAAAAFRHIDNFRNNRTVYMAGLSKAYKNGSKIGLEYYTPMVMFMDDFAYNDGYNNLGTLYYSTPLNEQLTGRVAFTNLFSDEGITAKFSVCAKY